MADSLDNQNAGVHQYTRSLIEALTKKKECAFEYVIFRQKKDEALDFEQIAVKNIQLPIGYASLRLFFIIPFLIRKYKIDIVFEPAHFGPFNLPKKTKRVTMIHDLTPILFPQYHRWHSRVLQQLFLPRILQKANLILSNSDTTSNDIMKYQRNINKDKVKRIYLGKDEYYSPILENEKITQPKPNPFFLFVGTIEPRKNIIYLLDAFEIFKKNDDKAIRLKIIGGKGWKYESIFKKLETHPNRNEIEYLGFVEKNELKYYYNHAMVMIYPSLYEGFGFPIVEAMSCGTNVITSNISSMPEVGGEMAYYCNPGNVESLTELMHQFSNGTLGRTTNELLSYVARFSWMQYAEAFEDALRTLSIQKSRLDSF